MTSSLVLCGTGNFLYFEEADRTAVYSNWVISCASLNLECPRAVIPGLVKNLDLRPVNVGRSYLHVVTVHEMCVIAHHVHISVNSLALLTQTAL